MIAHKAIEKEPKKNTVECQMGQLKKTKHHFQSFSSCKKVIVFFFFATVELQCSQYSTFANQIARRSDGN